MASSRYPTSRWKKSAAKAPRRDAPGPEGRAAIPAMPLRAISLLGYQRRWVEDNSPLKLVVKARQIGYSFAATLRAVLRCLEGKTTWIFLSKGERQSRLLMEKVQEHIQSCGIVARSFESTFFEGTTIKQLETRFPNGSVIYGLPANPDTARGYSGHVTLDEFAFHADADKIYSALFPTITRGFALEVISTPNGQQGKFYELAKAAGLADAGFGIGDSGFAPSPRSPLPGGEGVRRGGRVRAPSPQHPVPVWSAHSCDIYEAVRQGLKIDLELLRAGCDDEAAWQQEFCCQFVSTAENFFPPELLAACLSAEASTDIPPSLLARHSESPIPLATSAPGALPGFGIRDLGAGASSFANTESRTSNPEFYLGIDIGRRHDRTVFWLDEVTALSGHPERPAPQSVRRPQSPLDAVAGLRAPGRSEGSAVSDDEEPLRRLRGVYPERSEWAQHDNSPISARLSIARLVRTMTQAPFEELLQFARELLLLREGDGQPVVRRASIDATGMGAPLAESLAREFGLRVEPVVFTAAVKEDLAYRTKRRLENRLSLLPDTREIRCAFSAVKKIVTPSGNLRFDAERTEAGHADEFWAKALADLAADYQPASRLADGFLADGAPIVSPLAFEEVEMNWRALGWV